MNTQNSGAFNDHKKKTKRTIGGSNSIERDKKGTKRCCY